MEIDLANSQWVRQSQLAAGAPLSTTIQVEQATPAAVNAVPGGAPGAGADVGTRDGVSGPAGWEHRRFPGKRATDFAHARKAGREAVTARAAASASMLRHRLLVPPQALGKLRFSWFIPELLAAADLHHRDADDSAVRVVLAFEGNRSRFSARDATLSELALVLTGEPMPYATLMYVWSNGAALDAVIPSPRTDRIRSLVVETGASGLNRWLDYERDIRADYERAFGEAPGPLVGIALLSDTDNTGSHALAWYGPVSLTSVLPMQSR